MLTPEEFFSNTDHSPTTAPAASAPIPGSDADLGERLFGGGATPDLHEGGQTENERQAQTLFGDDEAEPAPYRFTVPPGLADLGFIHDQRAYDSFSRTARELGLDNAAAQRLVDLHLHRVAGR